MQSLTGLPDNVVDLLESVTNAEFATVSSAGVPIDSPMYLFPSEGLRTFDVGTGLSYPAKAERARKNPKVGLLIEGDPHEPVVAIAGHAEVHDTDLQANVERYLTETGYDIPDSVPWDVARKAVWYWVRILVAITPVKVLWWDDVAAMDGPPNRWDAPAGTVFPPPSAKPPGTVSKTPQWAHPSWPDQAQGMLASGLAAHLTVCDDDGYPLPIRVSNVEVDADGFTFNLPKGTPWTLGADPAPATLTYLGLSTFVGQATSSGSRAALRVERALPLHPIMSNPVEQFAPSDATYDGLMARLRHETERRGQPIPTMPDTLPATSALALRRIERAARVGRGAASARRTS
jgi:Pyridoxamine 5'-phosphate oxidase